jgi:hypothetical protein
MEHKAGDAYFTLRPFVDEDSVKLSSLMSCSKEELFMLSSVLVFPVAPEEVFRELSAKF